MFEKIDKLYRLIFDKFKFELINNNLNVMPPEHIDEQYKVDARDFIKENKNFIISVLKQNPNNFDILRFALTDNLTPLSFAQERLWFIEKYENGTSAYNVPLIFKVYPNIRMEILERCLKNIVTRHEILRTLIKEDLNGNGYQFVMPDTENVLSIRKVIVASQSQLDEEIQREIHYIFNLSTECPIKVCSYELVNKDLKGSSEFYISIVIHHIAFDGWSIDILLKELQIYYCYYLDISQGLNSHLNLPKLTIQYKDFALWQRSYLTGKRLEEQVTYWKNKLREHKTLNLITDKPRPRQINYKGADIYFDLEEKTSLDLRRLAKELKVSLYSLLLSGFYLLLRCYSNQDEIVIGTAIANRHYEQIENLIGFFVNSLVLKIEIDPRISVKSFIQKVGNEVVEAQLHQDLPFEKLVEELKIAKDTSRHPIFQVLFVLQGFGNSAYGIEEEEIEETKKSPLVEGYFSEKTAQKISRFDMNVSIDDSKKRLRGVFNYATGLYTEATIYGFIETYKIILKQFANIANDKKEQERFTISDLYYLEYNQYDVMINKWNQTYKDYPKEKTIQHLFEEQAERTPTNIAIIYEDQELSYQQLNDQSNQFAHYLRELGVGADTLVAVAVDRSLEMTISLLGTLKAGGAYVPLDPSYPEERLQFMLEDTRASVLITQTHIQNTFQKLFSYFPGHVIVINDPIQLNKLAQYSTTNPPTQTLSHHLAYVIYTSGSTGKPKGVMIEHGNLNHYISYAQRTYSLSNGISLFHSSMAFDMSITSLFLPLIVGNTIHILSKDVQIDSLGKTLEKHPSFSFIKFTPTHLKALQAEISPEFLKKQKGTLVVGGENLLKDDIRFWLEVAPETSVFNEYGPTETTVGCCVFKLERNFPLSSTSIPIGQPISNTRIYILDSYLNPVPIGASGEIYIESDGLARGYLSRSDLTAEKFIANPFTNKGNTKEEKNLRLYRTGDLARYLQDGNIEFLGRIDDQVKIRGFRVELGEIESILSGHGDVIQTVVMAREDGLTDKILVAYVVPGEFTPSSTELREFLLGKLPDYMVPSYFVFLDQLPLTLNGKIDRKSLPAPDLTLRGVGNEYVAPQSELQQELSSIWSEVLKIENIGIYDNFFKLGGHSLLAAQVISRIRKVYKTDVPLKALFEQPTIVALSEVINTLQKEQTSILIPPILPMEKKGNIPLSFAQQRLWFLDQLMPNTALYNIPFGLKLKGDLNIQALEKALNTLVNRHESLRTTFLSPEGEAYQVISPKLTINLIQNTENLTQLKKKERVHALEKLVQEEAATPFNLSNGSLMRIRLVILSQKEHVLLITIHHIIFDGWSKGIFFKELSALYATYVKGRKPNLPVLTIQYADFTLWQRAWIQGEILEKQLAYWKKQLSGIPDMMELPTDKLRPKELSYHGAVFYTFIPKDVKGRLDKLAQDNQASLFMTLLAVFQILLYKYVGHKEIVVGSPIANRHYKETEDLIGFFVNTLVIRTTFGGNESFIEVLNEIKRTTLAAYQNQDVYFDQLVDHLNIPRALNRNPLFQVEFTFINAKEEETLNLDDIEITPIFSDYLVTKFDLCFNTYEDKKGLGISIVYATDLFIEKTIEAFAQHFKILLENITRDPFLPINTYEILTLQEKDQLLKTWNNTEEIFFKKDKYISQLFEEQVDKVPNNIAVIYEDQALTYQVLNEKANQLAHFLKDIGVGPETLVAIALEKSFEMIIGLLGILKAGGVYIPLDPTYPSERQQFILEDTNVPIILTDLKTIDALPATWARLICLDKEWKYISSYPSTNPSYLSLDHHLAYIIYTSGTTGNPKGVMIEHQSVVNLKCAVTRAYGLGENDNNENILQFSNCVFDASIEQIMIALLNGYVLVLVQHQLLLENDKLNFYLNKNKITHINVTPTFLEQHDFSGIMSLKRLVLGGEPITKRSYEKLASLDHCKIINAYGPTETTVTTLVKILHKDDLTIGAPIANTKCYVLDINFNPLPIGMIGELYIGGVGLARGYLNQPQLTAERFIANPFQTELEKKTNKNARLYKTGDLARWLSDGNIEYVGRNDFQVKIRGFRIELGEIESALNAHVDVMQAVVIAREDESGDKKLVAYIVPQERRLALLISSSVFTPSSPSSSEKSFSVLTGEGIPEITEDLKNHLSCLLPDYMIPSFFVFLDQIPLTSNGKTDRKSLPAPDLTMIGREGTYIAPRNEIERELSFIWQEILKIDLVGVNDNFFKLGGHSLLATQVISRIRHRFGIDVPLRAIFEQPSIEILSATIESLLNEKTLSLIPPIVPQSRAEGVPLSFAQARLWFLDQLLPNVALYNMPLALRWEGKLQIKALEHAFNNLIERHEPLRTIFSLSKGEAAQVILPKLTINLEELSRDLSSLSDSEKKSEVEKLVLEEANAPFNLSIGPLMRVQLLVLSREEHVLLITLHHIISDGWSMDIFFKELTAFYNAYVEGKAFSLPPLAIQYADFALWQRKWIQGEVLEKQLAYWKKQLAGAPDLLELPTDKPRPQELNYQGSAYHTSFSKEIKDRLNQLAQENQASLFMILLATFQILLYRYSGQKDIVVGAPIANRHYKETEDLIGFFVNTLALRTSFTGNESFIEVLSKIKKTTLQAYQHQDTSFEQLVDQLNIKRDLNRNPVFQVMFNFLTKPKREVLLPNKVKISFIPSPYPIAKFDLTLNVYEHEEGIDWGFEYMTGIFESSSIERMAQHFDIIIQELIDHPIQSIDAFPLLTEEEKQEMIYQWNATQGEYSNNQLIHELFEMQALQEPNKIAVVYQSEQLTYAELNKKANQLARYLKELGVGPETLVGISIERSLGMVVGLLGILKTGAAYVPLDPSYPIDRLQYMLEDSGIAFLLTQAIYKNKFKDYKGNTILVDEKAFLIEQELGTNLPLTVLPSNLACLIYTSASSGKPKGVLLDHRLILNRFLWMWKKYSFTQGEVCCQKTSLSFVDAIWEIFGPILKGVKLVLIPSLIINDPREFIKLLGSEAISRVVLVPSLLQTILEQPIELLKDLKNLKICVVSGEALSPTISLAFQKTLLNNTKLLNLYGSTEIGADVSYYELCKENIGSEWDGRVPIGRPISNLQIYILDNSLNLVPKGICGEIYVGGEGLARGYLNRPELTAEKFIPNPFISEDIVGEFKDLRLYRTGDLGRYLSNGEVEFMGRADEQVKIRGFRIELGEIESALMVHENIAQAVVIAREDKVDDKKLVAYVVLRQPYLALLTSDSTFSSSSGRSVSVLKGDTLEFTENLKNHLSRLLPDYMIPSFFVYLDQVPLTSNGKTDRISLPKAEVTSNKKYVIPKNNNEDKLTKVWSKLLGIDSSVIGIEDNFFDIGGNSILTISLRESIENEFGIKSLNISEFFKYPTIKTFNHHILEKEMTRIDNYNANHIYYNIKAFDSEIAIVALSGTFPNSNDVEQLWDNIINGRECLEKLSLDACREYGVPEPVVKDINYIPVGGIINDIDKFDANFWKIAPNDAILMDPQIRKFLEHTWIALEKSGYIKERHEKRIGVFVGMSDSKYYETRIQDNEKLSLQMVNEDIQFDGKDFFATKVSYLLGLTGASVNINTACSTSLVAIVEACKNLALGSCDMAIAGGVSLQMPEYHGYIYRPNMIFSKDGHCNAFNENVSGTVFSAGLGVVVLKRLKNAIEDKDNIIAIIKGYATNNDGNRKVGYAAPSVIGQTECILEAQKIAKISADTIDYVECHGTGTSLGDPIEVAALQDAFKANSIGNEYSCILGAIKANIGHSNCAAGIAGLIKVCKMLQTKIIPPQINYITPNPNLNLENTNFKIITNRQEWNNKGKHPKRAGVSSFGIGGTNAHIILEEYIPMEKTINQKRLDQFYILPISAKSISSFKGYCDALADFIESNPQINLLDVAHTLQYKREYFNFRNAIVAKNREEVLEQLRNVASPIEMKQANLDIIFVFSGQGMQYPNMAKNLYMSVPSFKDHVDKCCEIISKISEVDFKEYLYPILNNQSDDYLSETKWAQPALFTICYSLAKLLEEYDIKASSYIGHSIGEYVAATLSGVFTLEEAINIVVRRGELMQKMSKGSMLSINLVAEEISKILPENLEISVYNAPEYNVVSGENKEIDSFKNLLDRLEIPCSKLHTSHAFHSRMMQNAAREFKAYLTDIDLKKPHQPFISNLSGEFISDEQASSASYWANHMVMPVQFSQGIETLMNHFERALYLEIGPGNSLSNFISQHQSKGLGSVSNISFLPSAKNFYMNKPEDSAQFYHGVGKLWSFGYTVNWSKVWETDINTLNVVDIPTYQFEKNKYWVELPESVQNRQLEIRPKGEWYYQLTWKRLSKIVNPTNIQFQKTEAWLVFRDSLGKLDSFIDFLNDNQQTVIIVDYTLSDENLSIYENRMIINLYSEDHYSELANYLISNNIHISYFIHGWTVTAENVELSNELGQYLGFYSLALLHEKLFTYLKENLNLVMVTNGLNQVTGKEVIHTNKGAILGAIRAIPHEIQKVKACLIDVGFDYLVTNEYLLSLVTTENNYISEPNFSMRSGYLWKEQIEPIYLDGSKYAPVISDNDVILISGGLGGIGLAIAKEISKYHRVRFLLVTRNNIGTIESDYYKESQLNSLEVIKNNGCEVEIYGCDIAKSAEVNKLFNLIKKKYKKVDGVIHTAGSAPLKISKRNFTNIKHAIGSKILGAENLFIALKNEFLKFFIMTSSLASLIGDGWRIEYCAANSYLDVFSGVDTNNVAHLMSINWLSWSEVGMAVKADNTFESNNTSDFENNGIFSLLAQNNVKEAEGAEIFYNLINQKEFKQVAVSKIDILKIKQELFKNISKLDEKPGEIEVKNILIEEDGTELENKIAQIFCQVLGNQRLSKYDSYFELGGNSLSAIKMLNKLNKELNINVDLPVIFKQDTVDKLSNFVKYSLEKSRETLLAVIEEGEL